MEKLCASCVHLAASAEGTDGESHLVKEKWKKKEMQLEEEIQKQREDVNDPSENTTNESPVTFPSKYSCRHGKGTDIFKKQMSLKEPLFSRGCQNIDGR